MKSTCTIASCFISHMFFELLWHMWHQDTCARYTLSLYIFMYLLHIFPHMFLFNPLHSHLPWKGGPLPDTNGVTTPYKWPYTSYKWVTGVINPITGVKKPGNWSYKPYNWSYNLVTGVINPITGVINPITGVITWLVTCFPWPTLCPRLFFVQKKRPSND